MTTPNLPNDDLIQLVSALIDDDLNEQDHARLAQMLASDATLRVSYYGQLRMHAQLTWNSHRAPVIGLSDIGVISAAGTPPLITPGSDLSHTNDTGDATTPPAPSALDFFSNTLHGTIGFFSQELPFSLLIATVLTSLGLWFASMIYVSSADKIAKDSSPPVQSSFDPTLNVVGKITGMVDVKWSDASTATYDGANVLLGRKYALASGLMEITYDTGAKVILQGPVTYEVESKNGGFLPVGKLTGKVEVETAKGFAVRTPTVTVTDLGTEFGVEVDDHKTCYVETFVGLIKVSPVVGGGESKDRRSLAAGEAMRIDAAGTMAKTRTKSIHFVRNIARQLSDAYAKLVLEDRPLVYWPLNESPFAQWVVDRSDHDCIGHVIRGVRLGQKGPWNNGRSRAAEFTGNDYIQTDPLPKSDPTKGFSVEVWAKVEGSEEPQSIVTDRDNDGGYMFYARPKMNVWEFSTHNGAATEVWDSIFRPIIPKQWTHLVGTFEPTGEKSGDAMLGVKKLYINGGLAASAKQRFVPGQGNLLRIGAGATELTEATHFFIGRLAEVAIYDHPLREDRIKAHYEASGTSSIVQQPSLQEEAASQPVD